MGSLIKLEDEKLSQLLKKFEKCAAIINHNRALAFKIVSIIDEKKMLQKESNYTIEQLQHLRNECNIYEPWKCSTKVVLEGLYSFFSWTQYVKFGSAIKKIDVDLAGKMTEDALILVNRNRFDLDLILPQLKALDVDMIQVNDVRSVIDDVVNKPKKKRTGVKADIPADLKKDMSEEATKIANLKLKEAIITMKNERKTANKRIKNLEYLLETERKDKQDLQQQLNDLRRELNRFINNRSE